MEYIERNADDAALYAVARSCEAISVREKAARQIRSRDFRYAIASDLRNIARTAMILDLYDPLEGDDALIARTILTDPNDNNKTHMLLYCHDEALLMLGWLYVYGARKICAERLKAMGSRYPEAYLEADPQGKSVCVQEWTAHAAETALQLLTEDAAVQERLGSAAEVDSEPLHFFLSFHHPRKAVRWWHAKKLTDPVYIAYAGSWTSDDQIKQALAPKISSTGLITEMIFGDLSAADPVFAFSKPEDLTLQDRFCLEIMKNNPSRRIREHVRSELLRAGAEIPGIDLTKPDPL